MNGCVGARYFDAFESLAEICCCMWATSSFAISSSLVGGKSTTRKTDPPAAGAIPIFTLARSALPLMSAGVLSVTQSSRATVPAPGLTFLYGLAPSNSTTAAPLSSCPVTTRRMSSVSILCLPRFAPALSHAGSDVTSQGTGAPAIVLPAIGVPDETSRIDCGRCGGRTHRSHVLSNCGKKEVEGNQIQQVVTKD